MRRGDRIQLSGVAMVNETPAIEDDGYAEADTSPKRLRKMARRVRLIAQLAVSDRTRRVLEAMAQHYDVLAARQDHQESPDSEL